MKIQIKNNKFIPGLALITLAYSLIVPHSVRAENINKRVKYKSNSTSITTTKNHSLDIHLLLIKGILREEQKVDFEEQGDFHLAEESQTISVHNQPLIAQAFSGQASWYGGKFHGRLTASGEVFNQNAFTAAHRYLPFGTRVQVTNLNNGRSVIVRINDRGPFAKGRIIDLSAAAARAVGLITSGVAPVRVSVLGR